jgi:hypothetical protein
MLADVIQSILVFITGAVLFWLFVVGTKILFSDFNVYRRNQEYLGTFWLNLKGHNPPAPHHTSILDEGFVYNVRKHRVVTHSKLTSDAAEEILR